MTGLAFFKFILESKDLTLDPKKREGDNIPLISANKNLYLLTTIGILGYWSWKIQWFLAIHIAHQVNLRIECQWVCKTAEIFFEGCLSCHAAYRAVVEDWEGNVPIKPWRTNSQTCLEKSHSTRRWSAVSATILHRQQRNGPEKPCFESVSPVKILLFNTSHVKFFTFG